MTQIAEQRRLRNGLDVNGLFGTLDALKAQPELGGFHFRARR